MPEATLQASVPTPLTTLSEDEILFRDNIHQFADEKIRPLVKEMDEKGIFDKELIGAGPPFFPMFAKTSTTEAAPVFAVFEGRGFRLRKSMFIRHSQGSGCWPRLQPCLD